MVFGICFDIEKDNLKVDENFHNSIWATMGYTKYLCPKCNNHLKDSGGELICLNGCHMPEQWQKRFHNNMRKINDKLNLQSSGD